MGVARAIGAATPFARAQGRATPSYGMGLAEQAVLSGLLSRTDVAGMQRTCDRDVVCTADDCAAIWKDSEDVVVDR